jgi:hypothetical protein
MFLVSTSFGLAAITAHVPRDRDHCGACDAAMNFSPGMTGRNEMTS